LLCPSERKYKWEEKEIFEKMIGEIWMNDLEKLKDDWLKKLSFDILLTRNCNYRCKHCLMNNFKGEMSLVSFKETIDQLCEMDVNEINLSGGEIFLHPNIKEIFNYLKLKNIEFGFVTNGSMFNENIIELIKQSNCRFSISLDGPEEFQINFRNYKEAFSNVINAVELCTKNKVEFGIISSYVKENLQHIDWLINFCIKNKIKYYRLQPVFAEGAAVKLEDNKELLSEKELDHLYKRHVELSGLYVGRLILRGLGKFKSEIIQHSCKFGVNFGSSCHSNSLPYPHTIGITPEGDVFPLYPYLLNSNWKINNIKNGIYKSLDEYYNSESHIKLLDLHRTVFENEIVKKDIVYVDYGRLIIERMNHN
jgi:MoaA/NifB/PqqE/SkfB family radical SAM enzyme